jgi:hypothetical protein
MDEKTSTTDADTTATITGRTDGKLTTARTSRD